jgi:hypothetical protein
MYTFLPKNICRGAKQLVEGCVEMLLFWFWHCSAPFVTKP